MHSLTEKEMLYIQDAMDHEELCIAKYNQYAQTVSCPQLKQLMQQLSAAEVRHLQTLQGFKGGQSGSMGSSGSSMSSGSSSGSMSSSSGSMGSGSSGGSIGMSSGMSGSSRNQGGQMNSGSTQSQNGGLDDEMAVRDLLTMEKAVTDLYSHAVLESCNQQLHQAFGKIQQEEQQHAYQLFQYAQEHGWYTPQ